MTMTEVQDETLDPSASKGDTKEGLYFGKERPADDPQPLTGPNQWPSEVIRITVYEPCLVTCTAV